jgi:hypothetical protein
LMIFAQVLPGHLFRTPLVRLSVTTAAVAGLLCRTATGLSKFVLAPSAAGPFAADCWPCMRRADTPRVRVEQLILVLIRNSCLALTALKPRVFVVCDTFSEFGYCGSTPGHCLLSENCQPGLYA